MCLSCKSFVFKCPFNSQELWEEYVYKVFGKIEVVNQKEWK